MTLQEKIQVHSDLLNRLDKLRGTGYWDPHKNNLWHTTYNQYLKLQVMSWRLKEKGLK